MSPLIDVIVKDGIATVTLNEPGKRNPLSPELVEGLTRSLRELAAVAEVRAVILVGAGNGFSAGADLRRMRAATPLEDRDEYDSILELNRLLWKYQKPTIAAVHGFALGAGANLMSWCDIAVADEHARIGFPEVKAGVPSATVIPSLLRAVSRKRMYELVLTGAPISAADALEAGLISRVAPAGTSYDVALDIAAQIAAHHPAAVAFTKEIIHEVTDMSYEQAIVYAKDLRVISRLRSDFAVNVPQGGQRAAGKAEKAAKAGEGGTDR